MYNNYVGVYSFKLFGKYWSAIKASRILFPFFVIWGITKIYQADLHFSWLDLGFTILVIPQYVAGFTNVVRNIYHKSIAEKILSELGNTDYLTKYLALYEAGLTDKEIKGYIGNN